MTMKPLARPLLLAAALGSVAWPGYARAADEVAVCVKASEQAQSLKDEGKLKRAREQLLICSRDALPEKIPAWLVSSQAKKASSPSTPYLATSA